MSTATIHTTTAPNATHLRVAAIESLSVHVTELAYAADGKNWLTELVATMSSGATHTLYEDAFTDEADARNLAARAADRIATLTEGAYSVHQRTTHPGLFSHAVTY